MTDGPVLVLGASFHQLEVIARGRRRGNRVIVADNVPENPGHGLADASFVVDTTDVDAIVGVADSEQVAAVIAPGTDIAMRALAAVAARRGLPGPSVEVAATVTSKLAFRRWQQAHSMPSPEAHEIEGHSLPAPGTWIVKPDRSSGSKGVRVVMDDAELADAVAAAREHDRCVMIERALQGHQLTIEGIVAGGQLRWAVILDRQTAEPPWCATTGHRVPTLLTDEQAERALAAIGTTIVTLDLGDGPVDADLVITADGPVVLELSPRLGGNGITSLVRLATGLDLTDVALDFAMGREPAGFPPAVPRPSAVVLLGINDAGALTYDPAGCERVRKQRWVEELTLEPAGTVTRPFVDGQSTVGRALITGSTRAAVDARVELLVGTLDLGAT